MLGLLFLLATPWIFNALSIAPPNHLGYAQFPALLLALFAVMFAGIACDPWANRVLIPYGMGLKVSYCAVVGYHAMFGSIPAIWTWFGWIDLVQLILFVAAFRTLGRRSIGGADMGL